ncbi:uncharacterized protein LOC116030878 [Ipomoea triloba]|uniref:uncharacterized protein LOC116030878 n=1 Tax=Ipomoea triloba TaxID=35885 RepID=UPI00125DAFD8|nr:uncharacterized protein LOC116030878 [Ipomoea triloba]
MVTGGPMAYVFKSVAICWCIWKIRNELIFNSKPWHANSVQFEANRMVNDWQDLLNKHEFATTSSGFRGAFTGSEGVLLYYVDAAVFPNDEQAYYGIVILNHDGGYVAAKNGSFRGMSNVHLAEDMAVKEALSWAKDRGDMKIMILSDCQLVCNFINGATEDLSYAGCVIQECKRFLRHFEVVYVVFVPRSANKPAHALTRAACSQSGASRIRRLNLDDSNGIGKPTRRATTLV